MKIIKVKEVAIPIVNTEQLAKGTGARFLECFESHQNTLIAKQWRRAIPRNYDVLIDYQRPEVA